MGEAFNSGAHKMPRPHKEGVVKVCDEVVLGKIKLDLTENVGEQ